MPSAIFEQSLICCCFCSVNGHVSERTRAFFVSPITDVNKLLKFCTSLAATEYHYEISETNAQSLVGLLGGHFISYHQLLENGDNGIDFLQNTDN